VIGADPWLTYVPAGTVGAFASGRGIHDLPRGQRKLAALETLLYRVVEARLEHATLNFFQSGAWSRISLGWRGPAFTGWYVNFERPYVVTAWGLSTMDLVLDLLIDPDGTPHWKDRDDFDDAIGRGILPAGTADRLSDEADRVLGLLAHRDGPFAPEWTTWRPDPSWTVPVLPPSARPGSAAWEPTAHTSPADSGTGVSGAL